MPSDKHNLRHEVPLVRLTLVTPFAEELDRRGIEIDSILAKFDLSKENLHSVDVFVTAPVMYELLEAMSEAADDRYLAVYVGETLDIHGWPVFTNAARDSSTFGEFILRFSQAAGEQATSVRMRLDTDGEYATFSAHRVFEPAICPAQADAFYVGLFSTIFQRCIGSTWNKGNTQVRVCDTGAIPQNYKTMVVLQGDRRGCVIRFPQEWLLQPFDLEDFRKRAIPEAEYSAPPKTLIGSVRKALWPHLHRADMNIELAAKLCGFDQQVLARKLRKNGTTINKEIQYLKQEQSTRLLMESDWAVSDIGNSIGFSDPAVFSRSFKRWTGVSPSMYRKLHTPKT